MDKYYIVYETKNKINGKKYIGCHMTHNIDDGYMGSGKYFKRAFKKYGIENFERKIIQFCESEKDMLDLESKLVTEDIITSMNYYNISLGGGSNFSHINKNLDKYRHHFKNKVVVIDENGNNISISRSDERWVNGELNSVNKGLFLTKDKFGVIYHIDKNDERWINGELVSIHKNRYLVKDKSGKCFSIEKTDERIKTGELVFIWQGRKHKEETKKKIGSKNSIHQRGSGNSQYGTCWIYNIEMQKSKKIDKKNLTTWLKKGWLKGRKLKF